MVLFETETIIKVEFYDLDPMGIVWHGNYIKYIEQARCDLLERLGYSYVDIKKDGFAYPIAKMEAKFIKPAYFRQELKVIAALEEYEPALSIKYTIFDAQTGEKIFAAKTMQICINATTMESVYTVPERLRKIIILNNSHQRPTTKQM